MLFRVYFPPFARQIYMVHSRKFHYKDTVALTTGKQHQIYILNMEMGSATNSALLLASTRT
jgi:hypothetical protein